MRVSVCMDQTPEQGAKKEESDEWVHGFLSVGTLWSKDYSKEFTSEEFKEIHKELNEFISIESGNNNVQEEEIDQHFSSVVPNYNKAKEVCNLEKSAIGKKSLSFLLKKIFICGSPGLGPALNLKDPIPISPPMTMMEKMLRAILQKKIHPQSPCQSIPNKKYLKTTQIATSNDDDEESDCGNEGSKWVKTDTEYIVLEM